MPKQLFVNLPVTDVARSAAFYEAIGCTRDPDFSGDHAVSLRWSETIVFMVMARSFYATLTPRPIADTQATSAALFALGLESRDAVDTITQAAIAAGGRELHGAKDEGFMYSRAFEDPDGHAFGPFHMTADAAGGDGAAA